MAWHPSDLSQVMRNISYKQNNVLNLKSQIAFVT